MYSNKLMAMTSLLALCLSGCQVDSAKTVSTPSGAIASAATSPTPAATATPTPTATATPTPAATATPTPAATATTAAASTSIVGTNTADGYPQYDKIAPNYDRASMLMPAHGNGAIPPTNSGDVVGAFRLICAPSHLAYDDPIVYPGQPGKSHLHVFFGNTKSDANSTYESLRTSGASTCGALNRSAYWMPALADGQGNVILPDYAAVYYKRRPSTDPDCAVGSAAAPKGCIGLPRGLRYIFGRTMQGTTYANERTDGVNFVCTKPSLSSKNLSDILSNCPVGAQLIVQLSAPNCWNGLELDTPDHRAHVRHTVYVNGKEVCPSDFPFRMPDFHFNVAFTIRAGATNWYFVSDRMPGMPVHSAGETVHADWFGAWDDQTLATWLQNCIDGFKNANGGDICDGTAIVGAAQPTYGWVNPNAVVPMPKNPLG